MTDEFTPEDHAKVKLLVQEISAVLTGSSLTHGQLAIANVVARIALTGNENPDRVFLNTIDTCMDVFRTMSNKKLLGQHQDFS